MDFHCDGKVNYSEFLAATISTINFNKEEKLWSAFKYFDTTDSGYITLDSVMDALKDSGVIIDEEGLKKTFNELQKKGKKINFNEFKAIALGQDIIEEDHEIDFSSKENENETNNKINLKFIYKKNIKETEKENNIRKKENIFIKEEKKESQDIFFEKVNFPTNFNENIENSKNNNKDYERNQENIANDKKENLADKNKNEKKNEGNDGNLYNINGNKNNIKSNNKSSKSNNKSYKSNINKSSKSNNKSSKSNIDALIEEHSIDNNDRFTEVNDIQD
jgi:hypothetical protein